MNSKKETNIVDFAKMVGGAWVEYFNWYRFDGGKFAQQAEEARYASDCLRLVETKSFLKYVFRHINAIKLDEEGQRLCGQICYYTVKLEWGDDAEAFFDWENSELVISKDGNVLKIGEQDLK